MEVDAMKIAQFRQILKDEFRLEAMKKGDRYVIRQNGHRLFLLDIEKLDEQQVSEYINQALECMGAELLYDMRVMLLHACFYAERLHEITGKYPDLMQEAQNLALRVDACREEERVRRSPPGIVFQAQRRRR